jgi:hypothetical protein
MKHFTIDTESNITVHASKKAARETGAGVFSSEEQLAELIGPDNKRLIEIWNSLTGVTPVTKFANRKIAVERIWKAVQGLGETPVAKAEEPVAPAPELPEVVAEVISGPISQETAVETDVLLPAEVGEAAAQPEPIQETVAIAEPAASVDVQVPDVAPAETAPTTKATRAKKAAKAPRVVKAPKTDSGPREGSKTAQVVEMLKREGGATITEIMSTMAWQKHTVRGFMAGAMKKAGYSVESFKPEGGERSYRISK